MSTHHAKKVVQKKFEDPELEAEVFYAKENGLKPPTKLASDAAKDEMARAALEEFRMYFFSE